ncbi:unnamed protein product [Brassica napus]|uniref:(rape) hypothetical protein n=1 Tax=Brassica napus TaxID=3708 RepID=A0A816SA96_BRANA|nr:unnamed protein product [Brassica napus]
MVMNTELLPTSRVVSTGTIFGFIVMDGWVNPATSQPNVAGLILGGSAGFKTKLSQSEMFDPPLQAKILNINTGKYVFGMGAIETLIKALEMGTIETLIVWENLDINRCKLKNNTIWRSSGEALWERLIKATSMTQSPTMS